ncbi:MAG: hypothetical protein V4645_12040 [Pseudomonadota bacterium]
MRQERKYQGHFSIAVLQRLACDWNVVSWFAATQMAQKSSLIVNSCRAVIAVPRRPAAVAQGRQVRGARIKLRFSEIELIIWYYINPKLDLKRRWLGACTAGRAVVSTAIASIAMNLPHWRAVVFPIRFACSKNNYMH